MICLDDALSESLRYASLSTERFFMSIAVIVDSRSRQSEKLATHRRGEGRAGTGLLCDQLFVDFATDIPARSTPLRSVLCDRNQWNE